MELRNAISSQFSTDVPATLAFDYPTEASLIDFIISKMGSTRSKLRVSHMLTPGAEQERSLQQTSDVLAVSCRYPKSVKGKRLCRNIVSHVLSSQSIAYLQTIRKKIALVTERGPLD